MAEAVEGRLPRHDHRGFLERERHPEIGVTESAAAFLPSEILDPDGLVEIEAADAGNDWTDYTYDARGNVLTKRLEGSTNFDLNYFYDGAGRLILFGPEVMFRGQSHQAFRMLLASLFL